MITIIIFLVSFIINFLLGVLYLLYIKYNYGDYINNNKDCKDFIIKSNYYLFILNIFIVDKILTIYLKNKSNILIILLIIFYLLFNFIFLIHLI